MACGAVGKKVIWSNEFILFQSDWGVRVGREAVEVMHPHAQCLYHINLLGQDNDLGLPLLLRSRLSDIICPKK